jgi:hypothetical protein
MNPAWPIENCPVNPLIRLSETASVIAMPQSIRMRTKYGLSIRPWKTKSSPMRTAITIRAMMRLRRYRGTLPRP